MMTAHHHPSSSLSRGNGGGGPGRADPGEFPSPRLFKQQLDHHHPPGAYAADDARPKRSEAAAAGYDDDDEQREKYRSGAASTSSSTQDEPSSSPSNAPPPPYLPTPEELALLCLDHLRDVRRCMAAAPTDIHNQPTAASRSEGKENRRGRVGTDEIKSNALDDDDGARTTTEEEDDPFPNDEMNDNSNDDSYGSQLHASLNPHYLTIAVWALQRAFVRHPLSVSNDPSTDHVVMVGDGASNNNNKRTPRSIPSTLPYTPPKKLPSLVDMEAEVLMAAASNDDDEHAAALYEYDDTHMSNAHRFYRNHGLGSSTEPWTLGELVSAGLSGLESRSRSAAEQELCQTALFQQFVRAVTDRGFFDDNTATPAGAAGKAAATPTLNHNHSSSGYHEKFQKVVAKFRTKLAFQADSYNDDNDDPHNKNGSFTGDWVALAAAETYRQRVQGHKFPPHGAPAPKDVQEEHTDAPTNETRFPASLKLSIDFPSGAVPPSLPRTFFAGPSPRVPASHHHQERPHPPPTTVDEPQKDGLFAASAMETMTAKPPEVGNSNNMHDASLQAAAEGLKNQGNVYMQQREFDRAADCYSKAIQLCPSGPHSHVYFSNRAAALVSVRQFHLAIADSQRSLALKPDYGKAYARLGLAHFLLGQYELAVNAYKESLRYEPDNRSSQNYLDKATRRLADQKRKPQQPQPAAPNSSQQSAMGTSAVAAKAQAGRMDPIGVSNTSQSPAPSSSAVPRAHSVEPQHRHEGARRTPTIASSPSGTPLTGPQQQAEKYKAKGNQFMVQREYGNAYDAYTRAIELSPDGPQSHVYYSNRAAALCYLERYREAERDSLSSLKLVPGYGKAHARLGLSRFFVGDYEGAVSSYRLALEHDPDNAASKSYLLKAQAKLQQQQRGEE